MLYTSSLRKVNIIYPNMYIVLVVRYRPRCFKVDGDIKGHVAWYPTLSPNAELLKKFKRDNDWDYYVREFYKQYHETPEMDKLLLKLIKGSETRDICMMCYCTDFLHCHTKLLTDIGKDVHGYEILRI